jgi:hypothetical protein
VRTKLAYILLYFHVHSGSGPDMENYEYLHKLYDTQVTSRLKFEHNIHPRHQQYRLHLKTAPNVPRAPYSVSLGLKSLSRDRLS